MKTVSLTFAPDGLVRAFEVENAYIGPSTVAQVLQRTEGVTDIELRRRFSSESEVHVRFKYQGCRCIVWEPYGDNSRYWIGPENMTVVEGNIAPVEKAFAKYQPPLHRAILGDVLTLRFLRR